MKQRHSPTWSPARWSRGRAREGRGAEGRRPSPLGSQGAVPTEPVPAAVGAAARAFLSAPPRRSTCEETLSSGAPASFITVPSGLSQAIWEVEAVLRNPKPLQWWAAKQGSKLGGQGQPLRLMCRPPYILRTKTVSFISPL